MRFSKGQYRNSYNYQPMVKNLFLLVVIGILISIIYVNLEKLNGISLLFFRVGASLLLVGGMGYISNEVESIAKAQVKSWMDSPGHKANILNPQYSHLGVGVVYDGLYYVSTQNFW